MLDLPETWYKQHDVLIALQLHLDEVDLSN